MTEFSPIREANKIRVIDPKYFDTPLNFNKETRKKDIIKNILTLLIEFQELDNG